MSLRLLIDEDSQSVLLVTLLREAGHDVVTVTEASLSGKIDPIVLDYAREENRVLLTRNCGDFEALHELNPKHPGILVIYSDSNPSKNMTYRAIIRAIANLEATAIPLFDRFIPLNQWNY